MRSCRYGIIYQSIETERLYCLLQFKRRWKLLFFGDCTPGETRRCALKGVVIQSICIYCCKLQYNPGERLKTAVILGHPNKMFRFPSPSLSWKLGYVVLSFVIRWIDSNARYFLHVPFLNKRIKRICIFRQLRSVIFLLSHLFWCKWIVNDRRSQETWAAKGHQHGGN